MINLSNKEILIIGGGRVASRRAGTLLKCGAKITAVSLKFDKKFPEVHGRIERAFNVNDINEKFFFVLAATDNREVNKLIHETARSKKIPVNVCDNQEECDFFFPSLISSGNVGISVCTGGLDAKLTRRLSDKLRKILPQWLKTVSSDE